MKIILISEAEQVILEFELSCFIHIYSDLSAPISGFLNPGLF